MDASFPWMMQTVQTKYTIQSQTKWIEFWSEWGKQHGLNTQYSNIQQSNSTYEKTLNTKEEVAARNGHRFGLKDVNSTD